MFSSLMIAHLGSKMIVQGSDWTRDDVLLVTLFIPMRSHGAEALM